MKAKSKVLLGLLVALAMMVMAVPAFAITFDISDPTPATQTIYLGDDKDASFTFNITDANGAKDDAYTVTPTDTAVNEDGTTNSNIFTATVSVAPVTEANAKSVPVTVTVPKAQFEAADTGVVGTHTFSFNINKTAGEQAGQKPVEKTAKIVVKPKLTAELTGATLDNTALVKSVNAGDTDYLNVVAENATKYQWQQSDTLVNAKWTDITGEDKSTLGPAKAEWDGKYVRCKVTIDGKDVIAASTQNATDKTAVKMTVTDTKNLTVSIKDWTDDSNLKDAETSYSFFEGASSSNPVLLRLTALATGGEDGAVSCKWEKKGETKLPDGVSVGGTGNRSLVFSTITKETAGKYTCTVTKGDLTKTSEEIEIIVKPTPTVKITEADGDAAKYTNPTTPSDGTGDIYLKEDQVGKAMTVNVDIKEQPRKVITWYLDSAPQGKFTNATSFDIPAANVKAGTQVKVEVEFEGLTPKLTYTATLKETAGTLSGGVLKSATGALDNKSTVPVWTITLPKGEAFKAEAAADTDVTGYENLNTTYGVNIVSPRLKNGSADDAAAVFTVKTTAATDTTPATMTIKQKSFTAQTAPVVGPLKIEVTTKGANSKTISLPVSDENAYNITLPAKGYETNLSTPKQIVLKDHATGVVAKDYSGKAVEADIVAASTSVKGLGEIEKIRYLKTTDQAHAGDFPTTAADIAKAKADAPVDAGTYWVICDIKDGEQWGGNKDQVAGQIVINAIQSTEDDAEVLEALFKIDPPTKVYNGKNQKPEVTFADGVTNAGKITGVKFFDKDNVQVDPLNVGKYTVKVSTDATGVTNANVASLTDKVIGTFEITKVEPTKDLYTMKPTEVTYTGAEQGTNVTKVDEKAGDVAKVLYYAEGFDKPLEGLPVEAGKYTVKIETKENDTYAAATGDKALELGTFTITKSASDKPAIWMIGHVQDVDWGDKGSGKAVKLEAGKTAQVGTTGLGKRVEAITILVPEGYKVEGFAHIQDRDDVEVEKDENPTYIKNMDEIGSGYTAYKFGTTGQAKRIEAINIAIKTEDGKFVEGLEYATHIQNMGWLGTVRNGSFSGSRGLALRMEAVRFYYDDQIRRPTEIDKEDTKTELR